jgi:O-antigen/teichoic acid export membrane protein
MFDRKVGARAIGNAGLITGAQMIAKVLGAIFVIFAARALGVVDYGLFAFAATFGATLGILVAFGIPQLITRSVARDPEITRKALGASMVVVGGLLAVTTLLMAGALRFVIFPHDPARRWIVGLASLGALLMSVVSVNTAFFRAHQRMDLEALIRISLSAANMTLGIAVLLIGFGVLGLVLTQLGIYAACVLAGLALIFRKLGRPIFSQGVAAYRELLVAAWPFAVASLFVVVYQSLDIVLLSFLAGDEATGLLAGAKNFTSVFWVLAVGLVGAFLPVLSHTFKESATQWLDLLQRLTKYLLVVALPVCVGLALVSQQLVPLILGQEFRGSALLLQISAFFMLPSFLNSGLSAGLNSRGSEKTLMRILGGIVLVSAITQWALISRWGAYGAAVASLITEFVMLASQLAALRRCGQVVPVLRLALRPLLSVAIMAGGVLLVRQFGLALAVGAGAILYPLALILLKTFDAEEMAMARDAIQRLRKSPVGHMSGSS